jgi:DNA-binding transcriptional LysR family regulator
MPQAMRRFRERHPGIEVRMCDVDSQRAHEKLVNAEVDIAVVSRRERSEGVDFTALFEDELVVVVPDALPELAGRKTLAPKQLAAYPLLLNPRGVDLREIIEERFRSAGLAVEPAQELTGTYPLVSLVRLGLGVSIQPRVALHGVSLEGCRLVEFRPATVREIGLLLLKDAPHSPATLAFMECLKAMDAADLSRPAPRKARRGVLSDTAKALSMK